MCYWQTHIHWESDFNFTCIVLKYRICAAIAMLCSGKGYGVLIWIMDISYLQRGGISLSMAGALTAMRHWGQCVPVWVDDETCLALAITCFSASVHQCLQFSSNSIQWIRLSLIIESTIVLLVLLCTIQVIEEYLHLNVMHIWTELNAC